MSAAPRPEIPSAYSNIGLPPLQVVAALPSGAAILGFSSSGDDAVAWWRRLQALHSESGLWPVLTDHETFEIVQMQRHVPRANGDVGSGAAVLTRRAQAGLDDCGAEYRESFLAELRGEGTWPEEPLRRGFALPFNWEGKAMRVIVALIPIEEPWRLHLALQYGHWNDYPEPAEHAVILKHWDDMYGARPAIFTSSTLEFAVDRPPGTREEALRLASEMWFYNDGAYDYYRADTVTELAASLIDADVWICWWD